MTSPSYRKSSNRVDEPEERAPFGKLVNISKATNPKRGETL